MIPIKKIWTNIINFYQEEFIYNDEFENKTLDGSSAAAVILGVSSAQDLRLTDLIGFKTHADVKAVAGPMESGEQAALKAYFEEDVVRLAQAQGQALRAFNDGGFIHPQFHLGNGGVDINLEEEKRTPSEMMREALGQVNHQLGEDLIDKVISMSPQFFERLVIELMEKMGYGEGKITNYTKDGGIDGIINEDKLGLGKIFIQAKRYQRGNNVGSPMTDAFVGAITKKGGNKGVFITTSDFTSSAKDNRSQSVKVAYINGLDLAKLMIQYGIGVTAVDTYVVNKIDSDYFDE